MATLGDGWNSGSSGTLARMASHIVSLAAI
jgi:hypothetical protein